MIKKFFDSIFVITLAGIFFLIINSSTLANELTVAQISDAHLSLDKVNTSYRLNVESKELLKDAVTQINLSPQVDLVIFSGDMINKPKKEELTEFIKIANTLNKKWYTLFGNHDISIGGYLSKEQYNKILSENNKNLVQKRYYSFIPKKGFKIILLDTTIDNRITANGKLDSAQLVWLDNELKKSQKDIVLIFMHTPIIEPFSSPTHRLLNDNEALSILKKYKNPIAIFSGHYHATKIIPKGNLLFVSTPSLVTFPNAFRIIKVTNHKNNVIFDIKLKETNLKEVQTLARMMVMQTDLHYGKEADRNFIYKIEK